MNDEEYYTLESIRKAIVNEPTYGLTRVLHEYENGNGWSLFRMDNNGMYDDTLPMWNENNDHGSYYAFFWTIPQRGLSTRQKCTFNHMRFFETDAGAVRWALVTAENLTREYKEQQAVEEEMSKRDEIPF